MHKREIKFVKDESRADDKKIMLRDTSNELLLHCAFDKHGYCRTTCAALSRECSTSGVTDVVQCLRLPREGIIGHLEDDE